MRFFFVQKRSVYYKPMHVVRCDAVHMVRCCSSLYKKDQFITNRCMWSDAMRCIWSGAVLLCTKKISLIAKNRCMWSDACGPMHVVRCMWSDAVLLLTKKISLITNRRIIQASLRGPNHRHRPMRCDVVHGFDARCGAYGRMLFVLYKKDQLDYEPKHMVRCGAVHIWPDACSSL